jgi:hypothetical protein
VVLGATPHIVFCGPPSPIDLAAPSDYATREYQDIICTQYLSDLLGRDALPAYKGYKANVDPSIATEFSTLAFRFGHSSLSGGIERHANNGQDVLPSDPAGTRISLRTDFFDPNVLNPSGVVDRLTGHISTDIGPVLKGDADGNSLANDLMVISEVRDLLFANGGLQDNGQDLIARGVERARDDGIGTYNQVREAYGLPAVTTLAQITSNPTAQQELKKAYGSVANIDPFEGGQAEDHVTDSDLGPLFTTIIADQFNRLRAGDRFFYLDEHWSPAELRIFRQGTTLAKVIEANTSISNLQSDVFVFKASISGTVVPDRVGSGHGAESFSKRGTRDSSPQGLAGDTVELEDASGNVLGTTVTDRKGHYKFDQLKGVSATGNYTVRLVVPSSFMQTSANPSTTLVSRGDMHVSRVNFTVTPARSSSIPFGRQGDPFSLPRHLGERAGRLVTLARSERLRD